MAGWELLRVFSLLFGDDTIVEAESGLDIVSFVFFLGSDSSSSGIFSCQQ